MKYKGVYSEEELLSPPKLTPAQLAAVRWPSREECIQRWHRTENDTAENHHEDMHWAIRYALAPLMPEGSDDK